MQSQIGHGLQGQELEDFLKANADKIETKTYMRYFDKTETEELKEELSNHMVELNDIEEEQREQNLTFKERKKPLVKRKKEILRDLKMNATEVTEDVYKMVDQEAKKVGYYNRLGKLITSRDMNPDEYQLSIIPIARTGTN
ncbi:hypothetical protein QM480_06665 [Flectobacillus sp. DC10W]|uniref:Uncharacterized protein n=1 Tax=Flectobacillus longus TaxID=2984207 RepID=A0ABT6YLF5_9BACT|nr:hypothetical protein [Flectobacillus longus]MDI9863998.1 hypothetical protein [Flectobacillus longus]